MRGISFDISLRRLHPVWLIVGAVIGRAAGLMAGLNFAFWFNANPSTLVAWQIFGAIAVALFLSIVMTSNVIPHIKGGILGLGTGFALAFYSGEIRAIGIDNPDRSGLPAMNFGDAIFFEWVYMHSAWIGAIIGIAIGAYLARKKRINTPPHEIPAPETSPSIPTPD